MQPKDLPDQQQLFKWYDSYAHGGMDRRQFLAKLSGVAAAGVTAAALFDYLAPNYANAEQVSFNDPDIKARYEKFPSPQGHGEGQAYVVSPTQSNGPFPVVLVIHENRGLNPYVKDVARRFAKQGFLAVAPDALYPVGGYPGNDDDGRMLQRNLDRDKLTADLLAAAKFAHDHLTSSGKMGVVGFCFGGSMTNYIAAHLPDLVDAAVPFYGGPAPLDKVADIRAPIMLQFGELDERVNARWPDYEKALKQHGKRYQAHFYPEAMHGFHNDSTPRYKPDAAELAWQRTVAFFAEHLNKKEA